MRYIIFKMVQPSHLKEIEPDGYYQKTIYRNVLEKLDVHGVEESHATMEDAVTEINLKKDLLKFMELTVIPVFNVSYDGTIY